MHVFADLQSYICTYSECKHALKLFPTRSLWAKHEIDEHFSRPQWRCFSCNIAMDRDEYLKHLAQRHKDAGLSKTDLEARVSQAEEKVPVTTFESPPCPLCLKAGWRTTKAYTTHLGQHLEEISLACLPLVRDYDSCSEADSPTYMEEHAMSSSPPRPAETQEENVPLSIERVSSSDSSPRQKIPRLG
jgi:hypothetical protein